MQCHIIFRVQKMGVDYLAKTNLVNFHLPCYLLTHWIHRNRLSTVTMAHKIVDYKSSIDHHCFDKLISRKIYFFFVVKVCLLVLLE